MAFLGPYSAHFDDSYEKTITDLSRVEFNKEQFELVKTLTTGASIDAGQLGRRKCLW